MKLLIFSPYYPPHIGGLESHAAEFNKYFAEKTNSKITVFTPQIPDNALQNEVTNKNIEIVRFPAFEIIPNYPLPKFWSPIFWKLFFNLYGQSFDITISRTRFFFISFIALCYAKTKKTKFVHIEHGSDFVQLSSKFKSLVAKLYDYTFGWLIFKCSDLNISISESVQKFINKFDKRKSPIIRRGIDIEAIIKINENLKIKNKYASKIIIGFVGRLIDGKGVRDLIMALDNVKSDNFICLLVGDGPQRQHLEELTNNKNLSKQIFFLGEKPRKKTIAIMKIFDIFINPSYTEGLPTSVLEASVCKNAIIATDVGGTGEIIAHNKTGLLIIPRDTSALQKGIVDLINNPAKIKEFGENAYNYTRENFSWDKSIQKYEEEFKELLADE